MQNELDFLTDKQKQMIQLVDETVEYYKTHPRSVRQNPFSLDDTTCMYLSAEGNKCAFSRIMTDEVVQQLHEKCEGNSANKAIKMLGLELPFTNDFYDDLQNIHDSERYWDGNDFNANGIMMVENFKRRIVLGKYD